MQSESPGDRMRVGIVNLACCRDEERGLGHESAMVEFVGKDRRPQEPSGICVGTVTRRQKRSQFITSRSQGILAMTRKPILGLCIRPGWKPRNAERLITGQSDQAPPRTLRK